MLNFLINCIIWICALYGAFDIGRIFLYHSIHKKIKTNGIHVIVAAKNQENQIEMFLRSIIFRGLYGKEDYLKNIIVMDLNSTDNTRAILEKFSEDYNEINLVEWDALKKTIDNMD